MQASNQKSALRLVDLLYSCAEGELSWSSFLDVIAEHFSATVVGITTNVRLNCVTGVDPVELSKYEKYYLGINPWLGNGQTYPEGKVLLTHEVLPLNIYRKTAFYNEWGRRHLVTHGIGGAIRVKSNVMLFLSINRGDAQEPFDEGDRELAQVLMPHLRRAANLFDRLNVLEEQAFVLDILAFPVLYVSRAGSVQWANRAAENLLESGRGLRLQGGKLRAQLASEDAQLQRMLSEQRSVLSQRVAGYGGCLRVTRADDGSEISLFLTRPPRKLHRSIGITEENTGLLIFVALQAIDANTIADRARKTWALTAAEAALAVELLDNESLQYAAEKLRITRNTAKSQLSAIFQKAGVRRQSELIRKLLALAVIAADLVD